MLKSIAQEGTQSKYNFLCEGAFDYSLDNPCVYNVGRAFIDARAYLEEKVSKKTEDWKWGDRIAIVFENPVWSSTWMKRFYYEKVPASGNLNTVNVAKFA